MTQTITAATLATWTDTDAELARALGVTRQAVSYARLVHRLPAPLDGRRLPRRGLSERVKTAIVKEAQRRGTTIAIVLQDCHAWAEGVEALTRAWEAREPNGTGNGWRVGPAWLGGDTHSDQTRRDAYLIAAAPDMLEALEFLLPYLEDCRMDKEARAAIKKARGEK